MNHATARPRARPHPLPKRYLAAALAVTAVVLVPVGLLLRAASKPDAAPNSKPAAAQPAADALPACGYANVLTEHTGYDDWQRTILDTILRLPEDYEPRDLVSTRRAGVGDKKRKQEVRGFVIGDLAAMVKAAKKAGNPIAITWGYRSFQTQRWVFSYWSKRKGREATLKTAARPGHSEHQLGTALDFKSKGALNVDGGWRYEPAGVWMREHAWEFGFIESYPLAAEEKTCYSHEPWHYRYFGREIAAQIHESGLTPREWLWQQAALESSASEPG